MVEIEINSFAKMLAKWQHLSGHTNSQKFFEETLRVDKLASEYADYLVKGMYAPGENLVQHIIRSAGHIPNEVAKSPQIFIDAAKDAIESTTLDVIEKTNGSCEIISHEEIKKREEEKQKILKERAERKTVKAKPSSNRKIDSNGKNKYYEHRVLGGPYDNKKTDKDFSISEIPSKVGTIESRIAPFYRELEKKKLEDVKNNASEKGFYEVEIDGIKLQTKKSNVRLVVNLYAPSCCMREEAVPDFREALLPPVKTYGEKAPLEMVKTIGKGIVKVRVAYKIRGCPS